MVTRSFNSKDLERGKRLLEERKKIWKSRKKFTMETKIPPTTLDNWERGGDISAVALKEISERGGDVIYILTGKRQKHTSSSIVGIDKQSLITENNALKEKVRALEHLYQDTLQERNASEAALESYRAGLHNSDSA